MVSVYWRIGYGEGYFERKSSQLLFAAKEPLYNHAIILKKWISEKTNGDFAVKTSDAVKKKVGSFSVGTGVTVNVTERNLSICADGKPYVQCGLCSQFYEE